jgi:hypothetical protein
MHILGTNSPLPLKKVTPIDTNSGRAKMRKTLLKKNLFIVFGRPFGEKRKEEPSKWRRRDEAFFNRADNKKITENYFDIKGLAREDDTLNNKKFSEAYTVS